MSLKIEPELAARYREAYSLLLDEPPRDELLGPLECLSDEETTDLQDHCASHVRQGWMTGIDTLEAVESIVDGAIGNANIDAKGVIR